MKLAAQVGGLVIGLATIIAGVALLSIPAALIVGGTMVAGLALFTNTDDAQ